MKFVLAPLGLLFTFVVLMVLLSVKRRMRIIRGQLAAYRDGDYEGQSRLVEGFKIKGAETAEYLFFHGAACFELGRLEEAERALRRSLALETNPMLKTICRDELAHVLIEQERYPEAYDCLEECIQEQPNRSGCHRAFAELLLRRGGDDAGALESARRAVEKDRAQKVGRGKLALEEHNTSLGESLAFLAWAMAKNQGSPAEIEAVLKEAFAVCGETTKPVLTELHFCAGKAYEALGNTLESRRHFERAIEIDPVGNYGRLCRRVQVA